MASIILEDWVHRLDRCSHGKKVALVIDNCPAHPTITGLINVTIFYLPPNTTSVMQPCDAGIIKKLNHFYHGDMLRKMLSAYDNSSTFSFNLYDVIVLMQKAWYQVDSATVVNCFCHCGFVFNPATPPLDLTPPPSPPSSLNHIDDPFNVIFGIVHQNFNISASVTLALYTNVDACVAVMGSL